MEWVTRAYCILFRVHMNSNQDIAYVPPHGGERIKVAEIGHFDLLFAVLYAAVLTSIFQTLAQAPRITSFEFFIGATLRVVVVDHWLLHFRNKARIMEHPYFSLVSIVLVLFCYAKVNHILSSNQARSLGADFWPWVILVFAFSFLMKQYYEEKPFYQLWDVVAVMICLSYNGGYPIPPVDKRFFRWPHIVLDQYVVRPDRSPASHLLGPDIPRKITSAEN